MLRFFDAAQTLETGCLSLYSNVTAVLVTCFLNLYQTQQCICKSALKLTFITSILNAQDYTVLKRRKCIRELFICCLCWCFSVHAIVGRDWEVGKQVRIYFHFNRALKRSLMKVAECKIAASLKGHCAGTFCTTVKTVLMFLEGKQFYTIPIV